MNAHGPIIGVLLAGGRSSRFDGGTNAFRPWPASRCSPGASSASGRKSRRCCSMPMAMKRRFASFGLPVIADYASPRIAGPLAGVLARMEWTRAQRPDANFLVTAATDTPLFPLDLVARLVEAADGRALAVAKSESGVHPVFGLWPIAIAPALRDLEAGKRKVLDWTREHGAHEVAFEPVTIGSASIDPFLNINRAEDLARAEALLRGGLARK